MSAVVGPALLALAALLAAGAAWSAVKAKAAEGDLSGVLANASQAAFLLAWACPIAWFGLYLVGVAAPDALIPGFVVLGGLAAALLITSLLLGVRRHRGGTGGPEKDDRAGAAG